MEVNKNRVKEVGKILRGKQQIKKITKVNRDRVTSSRKSISQNQKIMVIGELGGGTKYFSERALCGLYHDIKNRNSKDIPNYLIFLGSILPEIPKYATKGAADKLHIVEEGINNLDDAVIAVKPGLERIMTTLEKKGSKTKVYYIIGTEDRANIKNRNYDRLISAYNNSPQMLKELKEAYIKKMDINKTIILDTKKNLKEMEAATENDNKNLGDRYEKRISHLKLKISQITGQTNDYNSIIQLYENLQITWIRENTYSKLIEEGFMGEVFGGNNKWNKRLYREQSKYIINEYSKAVENQKNMDREKEPKRYKKAEEKTKKLANLMDALGYKNIRNIKKEVDLASSTSTVQEKGEMFTRNLRASHDVEEIARKIANLEIISHIKDAFGRKYPMNIMENEEDHKLDYDLPMYGIIPAKKFNILVMNNPTNTSNLFKNNMNGIIEKTLNLQHMKGFQKIRLVIGGHSAEARVKTVPIVDGGKGIFIMLAAPFIDTISLSNIWRSNTKTPYTMMYEKSKFKPTSGIWEVDLNLPKNKFTYLPLENFFQLSEKEYRKQKNILIKKLLAFKPNGNDQNNTSIKKLEEELIVTDRIILRHKMPSEWNNELMKTFLISNGIELSDKKSIKDLAKAIKSNGKNVTNKIKKVLDHINQILPTDSYFEDKEKLITFSCIADAHIGNSGTGLYAPQELMNAFMKKIVDEPTDVVIYGGDNLDANYKNYAFEIVQATDYLSNSPKFLEYIKSKLPKDQISAAMDRYKNRTVKQVSNIEDQLRIFIDTIRMLDGIPKDKKPDHWVISGNHYNKSSINRDEAIIESVAFNEKDRLTTVPGGDYGIGYGVKDNEFFMLRHDLSSKVFDTLRSGMKIRGAFAGHKHEFDFEVIGDQFIARAPACAYVNAYPKQVGISTSEELRGFSRYTVLLRREKSVRFTLEFVTQELLEKEGYLNGGDKIDQLIRKFNMMMNPATAPKVVMSVSNKK